MQIIVNKPDYWLARVETAMHAIETRRQARDEFFVENWRKGRLFRTGKAPNELPPPDENYPSRCNDHDLIRLKALYSVLRSGSLEITLSDEDVICVEKLSD